MSLHADATAGIISASDIAFIVLHSRMLEMAIYDTMTHILECWPQANTKANSMPTYNFITCKLPLSVREN